MILVGVALLLLLAFSYTMLLKDPHRVSYRGRICLIPVSDNEYQLCQDLVYYVDDRKIVIPQGFRTDLASIPRVLWSLYSPTDFDTIPPAILHDYLYSCSGGFWHRYEADDVFYYALVLQGVNPWVAHKFWLGVRLFGKEHFKVGGICDGRKIRKDYQKEAFVEEPDEHETYESYEEDAYYDTYDDEGAYYKEEDVTKSQTFEEYKKPDADKKKKRSKAGR